LEILNDACIPLHPQTAKNRSFTLTYAAHWRPRRTNHLRRLAIQVSAEPSRALGLASLFLHETVNWTMLMVTLGTVICVAGAKKFAK